MIIQVIICGFNRSLEHCIKSIEENVIKQVKKHCKDLKVAFVLSFSSAPVSNLRSEELVENSNDLNFLNTDKYFVKTMSQEEIDSSIREPYSKAAQNGPGWPEASEEVNNQSLMNALRYLKLLDFSSNFIDPSADLVLLLRPDLEYIETVDFSKYIRYKNIIIIPEWDNYSGFNDRIAIVPKRYISHYFKRIDNIENYIKAGLVFNPEIFLKYSLKNALVGTVWTEKAQRVRSGGDKWIEFFSQSDNSGKFFYGKFKNIFNLKVILSDLNRILKSFG